MKLYCEVNVLANAANVVSRALAINKSIPILEGIMLKASGSSLTLSAFNQELYIEKEINADVYSEGQIVVNGKLFSDYANKLGSNDTIELETSANNKLNISVGKSKSQINFFDIASFPELGEFDDNNSFVLKQSELKELLERAIFCVSSTDNRILLKSCNIEIKGDNVEAVCLDGFRVSISRKKYEEKKGTFKSVILGKTINDIIKVLADSDEKVKVCAYKNTVVFDLGDTKIRTGIVESEFYKYENNIPKSVKTSVTVSKNDFEDCLNRAGIISRDNFYNTVVMNIEGNIINIVAESEKGKIDENLDCQMTGEPVKICLNNRFIHEAIVRIKEDFVKIGFDGGTKPIVIEKTEGDDFLCVILPVRVV